MTYIINVHWIRDERTMFLMASKNTHSVDWKTTMTVLGKWIIWQICAYNTCLKLRLDKEIKKKSPEGILLEIME